MVVGIFSLLFMGRGWECICFFEGQFYREKYKILRAITWKFKYVYKGMYGSWADSQLCLPYSYAVGMIFRYRPRHSYANHLPPMTCHCFLVNPNSWPRGHKALHDLIPTALLRTPLSTMPGLLWVLGYWLSESPTSLRSLEVSSWESYRTLHPSIFEGPPAEYYPVPL